MPRPLPSAASRASDARAVVVDGGGLSALLAVHAVRKAERAVCWRLASGGGRAQSPLLGGVPVNLGPRAVVRGGAFCDALAGAGVDVDAHGFVPAAGGVVVDGDDVWPLPTSPAGLWRSPLVPTFSAKRELAALLARIAVGALDVDDHNGDGGDGEDIARYLDRHTSHPAARRVVEMLLRVASYCPVGVDRAFDVDCDARRLLLQMRRALMRGVVYVDGGWASLLAQLHDAIARDPGVRVIDASDVDVSDVDEAHERILCGAPGAIAARGIAVPNTTPVLASCLDLVVDGAAGLPRPGRRFALGLTAPLYFSVHSRPDGAGPVVVHVVDYAGRGDRAVVDAFADVVQPGLRGRLLAERFLPSMPVMHDRPRAPRAAAPAVVDGTAIVGDWVGAGALLVDAVAAAAAHAAATVVATDGRAAA
jgi:hypothetical protein